MNFMNVNLGINKTGDKKEIIWSECVKPKPKYDLVRDSLLKNIKIELNEF